LSQQLLGGEASAESGSAVAQILISLTRFPAGCLD
jgi:hypothetical protein